VFAVGVPGTGYTLRVRNLTGSRLEVVCSIDQRDALSNRPASLDNRGMVINAHDTTTFDGWRHNDNRVGRFVFGQPERSIAAQAAGDTSGVGIIGFAAFTERSAFPAYGSGVRDGGLERMPAHEGSPLTLGGGLGTGIGETIYSPVTRVSFTRSPEPPSILEIGYDTEHWMRQNGLIAPAEPVAFPAQQAFGAYERIR
jgi:hypothetical protein